jgi:hypothetical protein
MYGGGESYKGFWWGDQRGRNNFEDPDVEGGKFLN